MSADGGTVDKTKRGLYDKFLVMRTDGKSSPGEKHADCEYFVLDLDHDPHARAALQAYESSCRNAYPVLAADLVNKLATKRFGRSAMSEGVKYMNPEFIATPPQWPHAHLRPRSEAEAARLMTVSPDAVVFVFGSNLAGKHIGGAAATALKFFGAKFGEGWGYEGQSYAVPTMDSQLQPLTLAEITAPVAGFVYFASLHPRLTFYVTAIGTGIAGFSHEQMAPLFALAPSNCLLPPHWLALRSTPELTGKDL